MCPVGTSGVGAPSMRSPCCQHHRLCEVPSEPSSSGMSVVSVHHLNSYKPSISRSFPRSRSAAKLVVVFSFFTFGGGCRQGHCSLQVPVCAHSHPHETTAPSSVARKPPSYRTCHSRGHLCFLEWAPAERDGPPLHTVGLLLLPPVFLWRPPSSPPSTPASLCSHPVS